METIKYEDLSVGIRKSLAEGHVLAEHTVTDPVKCTITRHLTTVQLSVAYDDNGRSKHYCNDVCQDICPPGSVKLLMVEWPKGGVPQTVGGDDMTVQVNVAGFRLGLGVSRTPEQDLPPLRILREAQQRLEELRKWTFARYRIAVHNTDLKAIRAHAITLFFIVTGLKPDDDNELFGDWLEHLMDAVVSDDAPDLPEFVAGESDAAPDCGQ
jgi:hypothetical protein